MAIKKTEAGWQVDIQPGGRGGKRFRKSFPTKLEAKQWENWIKAKILKNPDWQPERKDSRTLLDLVQLWERLHGCNLKSRNYPRLKRLCETMGNPIAADLTPESFSKYREKRLATGISPNTINREHATLRSVFNELKRLGHWTKPNPVQSIRRFKIDDKELAFLTGAQIDELLNALRASQSEDIYLVALVCLATGARWGEAVGLRLSQIRHGKLHFSGTKSGKNRSVPIDERLEKLLLAHWSKKGKRTDGRLFGSCMSAFRRALGKTSISLPPRQATHVLRHTFASHFMMNGGNILALQRILGHANLTMTMRYAHLAPDHLEEARKLNPVSALTLG